MSGAAVPKACIQRNDINHLLHKHQPVVGHAGSAPRQCEEADCLEVADFGCQKTACFACYFSSGAF